MQKGAYAVTLREAYASTHHASNCLHWSLQAAYANSLRLCKMLVRVNPTRPAYAGFAKQYVSHKMPTPVLVSSLFI